MHLEELEKLENEYNIHLSEQDKLYMIVNKYTIEPKIVLATLSKISISNKGKYFK